MKIELKKEYNLKGEAVYWVYVDGNYVDSARTEQDALKLYDKVKDAQLNKKEYEILKSEEI